MKSKRPTKSRIPNSERSAFRIELDSLPHAAARGGGAARERYANETVAQNWSSRALERQVGRLYYERLLSSKDRKARESPKGYTPTVRAEAEEIIVELPPSPRDFVRDPVLLEIPGLPETGRRQCAADEVAGREDDLE